MKRGGNMPKRSPTAGSKCSKNLQSKTVSPNTISWSETEDGGRDDPSDEGKSVFCCLDVRYSTGATLIWSALSGHFEVLKSFLQIHSRSGGFFTFGYFYIPGVDLYENLAFSPCLHYLWYFSSYFSVSIFLFYSCLRPILF